MSTPSPPPAAQPTAAATAAPATAPAPRSFTVHLQNIPLFKGLEPELLQQIGQAMSYRQVAKDSAVLHKGSEGDQLLFLLAGRLRVFDVTEDGRELGLNILLPGDYFGELSVIDGQPRSATVVAMEPALVAQLPAAQVRQLIYRHPLLAERMMQRLVYKIRQAAQHRAILGLPQAHQRVYALLLQLMKPAQNGQAVIERVPTQYDISIMANTSRETVSRALAALAQQGVAVKQARRLVILVPKQLQALVNDAEKFPA